MFIYSLNYMYSCLSLYVPMSAMLLEARVSDPLLRAEFSNSCEPPTHRCWELNVGLFKEQDTLLTEPSLQPGSSVYTALDLISSK